MEEGRPKAEYIRSRAIATLGHWRVAVVRQPRATIQHCNTYLGRLPPLPSTFRMHREVRVGSALIRNRRTCNGAFIASVSTKLPHSILRLSNSFRIQPYQWCVRACFEPWAIAVDCSGSPCCHSWRGIPERRANIIMRGGPSRLGCPPLQVSRNRLGWRCLSQCLLNLLGPRGYIV